MWAFLERARSKRIHYRDTDNPIVTLGTIWGNLSPMEIFDSQITSPEHISSDEPRAQLTAAMLRLSSRLVDIMSEGMTSDAAQEICELLLPNTAAIAVAITDTATILGYAGYQEAYNPQGAHIKTQATHDTIKDGCARVIYTAGEIGLPATAKLIKAAILVPLRAGREIRGTLKFYFDDSSKITETQKAIAQGFGVLLSTHIAATELEAQRDLATAMELKMLQNQINPHFLFNTINTIASLIRTDPPKARVLLREFATFYRSTLEHSQERIELARELEQTQRYFMLEVARFGEERLEMTASLVATHSDDDADDLNIAKMMVPPFLLQPIVENAVKHAMPVQGKLTVGIGAQIDDSDVLLHITDDGVGMDEQTCASIMQPHPRSQTGLGIAIKNVNDRMKGFYGQSAEMVVTSKLGAGTKVTLRFPDIVATLKDSEIDEPQ